ncbi:hypothetical protein GCM10009097_32220 [Pigmentiphaga daeguensis]|jgi:NADH:ubiquinone oxidoreductase subunit 5 (subunit L)/multisubunit Na+/H+ antiporter MnhA subunit|uniref:Uncharacterized protein n=2 Tax=Alcaligenaceae TaxID=506 RepID=A0ABN1C5X5_9BURK
MAPFRIVTVQAATAGGPTLDWKFSIGGLAMATFLVFIGIIAATVAVIYILVKLLMMFNGGDKNEETPRDVASSDHHHGKVETVRK